MFPNRGISDTLALEILPLYIGKENGHASHQSVDHCVFLLTDGAASYKVISQEYD